MQCALRPFKGTKACPYAWRQASCFHMFGPPCGRKVVHHERLPRTCQGQPKRPWVIVARLRIVRCENLLCRKPSQTVVSVSERLRHLGGECDRQGEGSWVRGMGYGGRAPLLPERLGISDNPPPIGEEVRFHCRSPCVVSADQKNTKETGPVGSVPRQHYSTCVLVMSRGVVWLAGPFGSRCKSRGIQNRKALPWGAVH